MSATTRPQRSRAVWLVLAAILLRLSTPGASLAQVINHRIQDVVPTPLGTGQRTIDIKQLADNRIIVADTFTLNRVGEQGQGGGTPRQAENVHAYSFMVCAPFNPDYDYWWDWYAACGGAASAPARVGIDPREFALGMLREVGLPQLQVHANPGLGLVALPSWFWIEGYDGRPFGPPAGRLEIPPEIGPQTAVSEVYPADCPCREPTYLSVELRLQPVRFAWRFGDSSEPHVTRSLGRPFPQESDIQHTYQHSSLYAGRDGFPVEVHALYHAAFRVDEGEWQDLGPIVAQPVVLRHRVQEIQAVLVGAESPGARRGR